MVKGTGELTTSRIKQKIDMFKKLITYLLIITFTAGLFSSPAMAFYYSSNSSGNGFNVGSSKSKSFDIWSRGRGC
jgi:hypothetical protein